MMSKHYILKNQKIVAVSLTEWAHWLENHTSDRIVKQEQIGDAKVSTVFLGLDHNFDPDGPPVLWETMIFGGKHDQYQERCAGGLEQAEAMHQEAVKLINETNK